MIESTTKNRKKICIKTQHKPKKLIFTCADKIDGLILVLETLRRNEAVQHTASTILFLSTSLFCSRHSGRATISHTSHHLPRYNFLPRQKISTRKTLSSHSHHFNSNLPFCLFFFFFSFRDCRARFYRSSERQKRFSWFLSLFENVNPKFYSTFAYSSIDSCFCPLAHFSPGHALRIRSVRHHFWTGLARVVFAWQLVFIVLACFFLNVLYLNVGALAAV